MRSCVKVSKYFSSCAWLEANKFGSNFFGSGYAGLGKGQEWADGEEQAWYSLALSAFAEGKLNL